MSHSSTRAGFSLLEVLLATAILLACAIVLGELATIGSRNARAAQDLGKAQILCETVMNEIAAGITPLEPLEGVPTEGEPGWMVSVDVQPVAHAPGLTAVRVTVSQDPDTLDRQRPRRFTLVRWLRAADALSDSRVATNE
jgi:prepilin-type N-terminal cleavage/methylation domain-containing protein